MAERHRPSNLGPNRAAASHARPQAQGGQPLPAVRRNLFQNSQNAKGVRRPAPNSSNTESLHLDVDVPGSDSSEIVVRDSHGEIELGDPPTPEMEDQGELLMDTAQESELERQRLAEAVKHHQINSAAMPDQPEELLEAVRASLRAKVAGLAEDSWMYEPDEPSRGA